MATPGTIGRVVAAGRIALASAMILTTDMVGNGIGDGFGIVAALAVALIILVTTMVLPPADDDDRWCP